MADLPINDALPELFTALRTRGMAVLQAPPGAGKTTRVPLALLEEGLAPGRMILLEPRRLAARAAAARMAQTLGEPVGRSVGYRMRGDTKVSKATRIEVVTEGILTRMIQKDPALEGIGTIIFDEFHERSLQADLGLALTLELRGALREDLALVVMSATLDAGPVAALIGDAPVVTSQGRSHPVETRWLDRPLPSGYDFWRESAGLVIRALKETDAGDVLVFLPGAGDIHRVAGLLGSLGDAVGVHMLYGAMPPAEQDRALAPDPARRKVILSTSIAETSLTIPGLRVVVDTGRARRARVDPGTMMGRLVTDRVTRAEAAQRSGRAGREAPGVAYRLWARAEDGALAAYPAPEIQSADLTRLALDLAQWGAKDAHDLAFLDPPASKAMDSARAVLARLGALDDSGSLTPHGAEMARLPVHPRLAHMLLTAGPAAAPLAAYLDRARGAQDEDLEAALRAAPPEIRREAKRLAKLAPPEGKGHDLAEQAALAFPDRVARRRTGETPRWVSVAGTGMKAERGSRFANTQWLVVTDSDGDPREARIRQAIPISEDAVRALFADQITWEDSVRWNGTRVEALRRETLGAIGLKQAPWAEAPAGALVTAMIEGIAEIGLTPGPPAARFMARVEGARAKGVDLPAMDEATLIADAHNWLAPYLTDIRTAEAFRKLDLLPALEARLGYAGRQALDAHAPSHFTTPLGRRVPIDYGGAAGPEIAVKLQELLGVRSHPQAAGEPLRITLLSPAGRPIQVTADLPSFWTGAYPDLRKDMRGRYPKHDWPEDPANARPQTGVKRRP
ncbi:MAG: ATP-dependent helicase HrpB [Pseudomonadota bacterium]